jgi:hypothetical protein
MADTSAGWTYSITLTYNSRLNSAEWIHESPSLAGAVPVPVGNSGVVTFDGPTNSFTAGGTVHTLQGATALDVPVEMTTSPLDSDTDGFNVCTYRLSCSPPTT